MYWFILLTTLILSSDTARVEGNIPFAESTVPSTGDVSFFVDRALFRISDSLSYLEVYYFLDLETLGEIERDGKRESDYLFTVKLEDLEGKKKPLVDSWTKKALKGALSQFVIDKFDLIVSPGRYRLTVEIEDKSTDAKGRAVMEFTVRRWEPSLTLSDIELAKSIRDSTGPSSFNKYALEVIPNPLGTVYPQKDTLYFYLEVYNLEPDSGAYIFTSAIYDAGGKLLRSTKPRVRKKRGSSVAIETGGIPLGGFEDGEYLLSVEVVDLSTSQRASASKPFRFVTRRIEREVPKELMDYLSFIDYVASPQELKAFKKLKDEREKKAFLTRFWKKRDPDPETPENEFLREFIERVKYADRNYSQGGRKGRYTDRGRIYIRYGPPDQVQKVTLVSHARDREEWTYFTRGRGSKGMKFIFVDIDGTGNYELVYSSIEEEPTRPDWKSYLKEWGLLGGEE